MRQIVSEPPSRALGYGTVSHRLFCKLKWLRDENTKHAHRKSESAQKAAAKRTEEIAFVEAELRRMGFKPERGPLWSLGRGERAGTIYIVSRGGGAVKIGFTTNLEHRLGTLQTGMAEPIELLASFEGTSEDERRLHTRFAKYRLRGEWFRLEGELFTWVRRGCPNGQ